MAVLQVSQIQVRSGFYQDLGQLARGEFGWAVDQLRLFIGNGTTSEGAPVPGNTELLTLRGVTEILSSGFQEFQYRFKGLSSGYEAQTGATNNTPIIRDAQRKFDDIVNVKDFGAVGDGITNDTAAIQRCIDQIYDRLSAAPDIKTRRTIHFYPGIYIIAGELRIPPYVNFKGVGKAGVVLKQVSAISSCLFRTTSSTGQDGAGMTSSGTAPQYIEFENIVFETEPDIAIAKIESAKNVSFIRCRFKGPRFSPANVTASSGVEIRSNYFTSENIYFSECDFTGLTNGALITETQAVRHVVFDRCLFTDLYRGISANTALGANSQISLKTINNLFTKIHQQGIYTDQVNDVVSLTNTFVNVGTAHDPAANATVVSSIIRFGGNSSYSFGDVFTRNDLQDSTISSIDQVSELAVSINQSSAMKFGATYQTIGRTVVVNNAATANIPLHPRFKNGTISYIAQRSGANRVGQLQFSADTVSGSCTYRDSYTEHTETGINLNIIYSNFYDTVRPILTITADSRGNVTAVTYDVKSTNLI